MSTNTYKVTSPDCSIDRIVSALSRQEACDQVAFATNYDDGDLVATLLVVEHGHTITLYFAR